MATLKTLLRHATERRSQPRYCEEPGCGAATREGKPFCPTHVERNPYVQQVLATLRSREQADERVRQRGARPTDVHSLTAQEILHFTEINGPKTVRRLARELNQSIEVIRAYAKGLERQGLVSLTLTRRRRTVVHPDLEAIALSREPNGENKQAA